MKKIDGPLARVRKREGKNRNEKLEKTTVITDTQRITNR
jgi:hypothetical protein